MSASLAVAIPREPPVEAVPGMTRSSTRVRLVGPEEHDFLTEVARLAAGYPHPHSIFGGPKTEAYVRSLAEGQRFPGEGWYGASTDDGLAAVHLGVYGVGDSQGHSLFKLRHPLFEGPGGRRALSSALDAARQAAGRVRPGSQKLVVFLGENERGARQAAEAIGFLLEGTFHDYYRLGERCLVLGNTVISP